MSRRFEESELVVATRNPGKLRELRALMGSLGVEIVGSGELGLPEPVEDGSSFADNARIKAHAAAAATGLVALADDSGFVARGLSGAPGVQSARWAGPARDFDAAMQRVYDELAQRFGSFEAADRHAAFVAVLCLAWPDGHEELAEGRVEGEVVSPPRGTGGFGYDPIFVPKGHDRTFAEFSEEEKHALSHRGRAIRDLVQRCF